MNYKQVLDIYKTSAHQGLQGQLIVNDLFVANRRKIKNYQTNYQTYDYICMWPCLNVFCSFMAVKQNYISKYNPEIFYDINRHFIEITRIPRNY